MSASPATAVVVDFESVPSTSNTTYKVPFTTQGFTFTPLSEVSIIDDPTLCLTGCVANGGQYLASQGGDPGQGVAMAAEDGSPFSLLSFDGAELFLGSLVNFPNAARITLGGVVLGGSTIFASFDLDGLKDGAGGIDDFQSFVLPTGWSNLLSVTFSGEIIGNPQFGAFSLDNINAQGSVPEPTTMLLLGSGLLVLSRRRPRG
jgi:hypothetical protein